MEFILSGDQADITAQSGVPIYFKVVNKGEYGISKPDQGTVHTEVLSSDDIVTINADEGDRVFLYAMEGRGAWSYNAEDIAGPLDDPIDITIEELKGSISSAAEAGRLKQQKLTVFGNSISESLNNFGTWFARASDGGVVFFFNAGIGGNTTPQMVARLDDIPDGTTMVTVMEATNDAASQVTPEEHAINIRIILENILSRGMTPIMIMAPPHDDPARSILVDEMNLYDFVTCQELGVACIEIWDQFTDTTDGSWVAGASDDGTHPNPQTELTAGNTLNDKWFGSKFYIPLPRNNPIGVNNNSCFIDSSSGTPSRWTTNGSQNTKVVAPTALGIGNTWTTNWVNSSVFLNSSYFDVTAGDRYQFVMRYSQKFNSGSIPVDLFLEYNVSIGGVNRVYFMRQAAVDVADTTLSLDFVVPDGVSTIRVAASTIAGTFDLDINIAQMQYFNLTEATI